MLLWEPSAPAPVTVAQDHYSCAQNLDLNVYNQLLHTGEHFEMAKSGLQMGMQLVGILTHGFYSSMSDTELVSWSG